MPVSRSSHRTRPPAVPATSASAPPHAAAATHVYPDSDECFRGLPLPELAGPAEVTGDPAAEAAAEAAASATPVDPVNLTAEPGCAGMLLSSSSALLASAPKDVQPGCNKVANEALLYIAVFKLVEAGLSTPVFYL